MFNRTPMIQPGAFRRRDSRNRAATVRSSEKKSIAADERRLTPITSLTCYPRSSATQQTAPQNDCPIGRFRVIHPFHPLYQQQLEEVGRTRRWGDERVWFRTASGDLRTIPIRFTSMAAPDAYLQWGGGKSWHRVAELIELRRLLDRLRDPEVVDV